HRRNVPRGCGTPAPHANVVCRRLSECARAGDVAAANVEPVASDMPLWDFCHRSLPDCFSGQDVLWFPSRLTAAEPAASYSPPAALASISTPQAAKPTPAIRPNQRPIGIVFSKRTKRARPAIQNRFMIPPKKRRLIKNQQQPRQ